MSKHTLFIILFLFETLMLNAQKLTVESLRKSPAGNSAHTEMRTDLNGKACALLRVSVSDDIVSCSNGNIGDVVVEGQTKLLYITSVTPFIELSFKNHFPLSINFIDYGFKHLESGATFDLVLVEPKLAAGINSNGGLNIQDEKTIALKKKVDNILAGAIRYSAVELNKMKTRYENVKQKSISNWTEEDEVTIKDLASKGYVPSFAYAALVYSRDGNLDLFEYFGLKALSEAGGSWIGYNLGNHYKKKNDFEKARICYEASVNSNWREHSCYELALLYENGNGVTKDLEKAKEYLKKSFLSASFSIEYSEAYREYKRLGGRSIYDPTLFKDAEAKDLVGLTPQKMYEEGNKYFENAAYKKSPYKGFGLLKAAAQRGVPEAMFRLSSIYKNEIYGLNDTAMANKYLAERVRCYEDRVAKGDVGAYSDLAYIYSYGVGVSANKEKSNDLYRQGAEHGNSYCCFRYAEILSSEKKDTEAFAYYKIAAEKGNVDAMYELSHCYLYGKGTDADDEQYLYWLKKVVKGNYHFTDKDPKRELEDLGISVNDL